MPRLTSLFVITLIGSAAAAAEITLREKAETTPGSLVRLGDVATVVGPGSERLARLPLMPAPAAGREFLSAQAIREMLAAQGESTGSHRIGGSYFVTIGPAREPAPNTTQGSWRPAWPGPRTGFRVRTGTTSRPRASLSVPAPRSTTHQRRVAQELVMSAIQAELDRTTNIDPEEPRLAVRGVELSATGVTSLSKAPAETLSVRLPHQDRLGAGDASVEISTNGESFRVVADLVLQPLRLVSTAAIARGGLIVASMVRLEPTPLEELDRPTVAYTAVDEAIGREAKVPLRSGDVLSALNTAPPVLVERGEEVSVSSGGGGVSVRLRAVAKRAGRQGELVPVETLDRGDEFMARVVGPRQLAVLSGAGPTPQGDAFTRTGGLR